MDIRTRSVEQTLSRLVSQITTLVNGVGTPKTRGTSWGVSVAVELGRAVERFVAFGEALAENQPQVKVSAMEACGDARRAGAMLAALVCLRDPEGRPQKSPETAVQGGSEMVAGHVSQKNLPQTSSASLTTKVLPADRIDEDTKFSPLGSSTWKRASLSSLSGTVPSTRRDSRTISAHAGRLLLSSVSRMLMLADQTVVSQIETAGKQVQGSLREMEVAKNMKDLVLTFNKYSEAVEEFVSVARYREEDLKDELEAAEMGAARDVLEKSPVVLLTSYKAWLKFPLCETAQVCRAGALDRIRHAVNSIIHLSMYGQQAGNTEAVAVHTSISGSCSQPRMSTAIDNFKGIVEQARDGRWSREEWATYSDQLSALLSRAQIMSESVCVPDVARDSVKGCIGQARHDGNALLQAGEHTMSLKLSECTMEMEVAVVALCRTLDNLKTQLREVATRVASLGAFEQSGSRALARLEAAVVAGDTESVTGLARQLFKHSDGLVEVCNLLLNAAESVAEEVSCAHARDLFDTLTAQLVSACRLRAQYPSSGEVLELTTACHQVWEAARETLPCLLHPTPPIDYERAAVSGLVQDVRWLAAGLEDEGDLWDTSGAAEEAVAERSRAVCNLACALCLQSRGQSKSEAFPELPVLAKAFTKECQRLCETLTALSTKLAGRKEWTRVLADLRRVPGETSENELDGTTESTEAIPSLQAARQALSALLPALRRARTLQDQLEGRLPCPSSPRPVRKTQDSVDSATALRHHREQQDHHIRLQAS